MCREKAKPSEQTILEKRKYVNVGAGETPLVWHYYQHEAFDDYTDDFSSANKIIGVFLNQKKRSFSKLNAAKKEQRIVSGAFRAVCLHRLFVSTSLC